MTQIPRQDMKSFKEGMFKDYVGYLEGIAGQKVDIPFEQYFEDGGRGAFGPLASYYFTDQSSDNAKIGFALIEKPDNLVVDSHKVAMLLWQFYIDKSQQDKGLGGECARLLLGEHHGHVMLKFYNMNTNARKFWDKVIKKFSNFPNEQKHLEIPSPDAADPSTFYMFSVQRGINGIAADNAKDDNATDKLCLTVG